MIASSWRAYRPPATDVLLAAVCVAAGQLVTWTQLDGPEGFDGPRSTNAVFSALFLAALAWRRRAPLGALCWAFVVFFLPHLVMPLDVSFVGGAVPLIALTASAGYYCTRRRALLSAGVGLACMLVATVSAEFLRSPDAFVFNAAFLLVPWLGGRGLREREDRAATLAASLATERASKHAALRDAAAAERAHIARELHDVVAHSVSMMVIQIGAARMQLQSGAAAATVPLLDAEEAGRQTLQDLRRLLGVLRADDPEARCGAAASQPQPPQPRLSQLHTLVEPLRAAGLQVDVRVLGEPVALPAALDLTAYRIVQEALTNIVKHSGASQASVQLRYAGVLGIDVLDDGRGAPAIDGTGHGLIGITERVSLFGGSVTAGPGPEGGWRVRAELPLPDPAVPGQRGSATPVR